MAKNVKPVPEGYHTVTPSLACRDAARAIEFYKDAFGAEERDRFLAPDGRIAHAEIKIGDSIVMIGEENPAMGCSSPLTLEGTPVSLYVYVNDVDSAWKRATAVPGATVKMPLDDMFWGDRMGALIDPFGHVWNLAQHKKDLTRAEVDAAGKAFFEQMARGGGKP